MVQVNPRLYYSISELAWRLRMAEHNEEIPEEDADVSQYPPSSPSKSSSSFSSSSSSTPDTSGQGANQPTTSGQAKNTPSVLYPSPHKPIKEDAFNRPSAALSATAMLNLNKDDNNQVTVYNGTNPTDNIATSLLELEITKHLESSRLWVHVDTNMLEDSYSKAIRDNLWFLSTHGIPPHMIAHLFVGDIAGLLIALIPMHQGRADELQATAVVHFDQVKKLGVSFLYFLKEFGDAQDRLIATGIEFPATYLRLKFIMAMKTDPLYKGPMVTILSHRPAYDMLEMQEKLTGFAQTFGDCNTAAKKTSAFVTEGNDSSSSSREPSAASKKAAKKARKQAAQAKAEAKAEALVATDNDKPICFNSMDGKTCTTKNCHFRHDASKKDKEAAAKKAKSTACKQMRDTRDCPRPKCKFSHDPAVLDKARKLLALSATTNGEATLFEELQPTVTVPPAGLMAAHGLTFIGEDSDRLHKRTKFFSNNLSEEKGPPFDMDAMLPQQVFHVRLSRSSEQAMVPEDQQLEIPPEPEIPEPEIQYIDISQAVDESIAIFLAGRAEPLDDTSDDFDYRDPVTSEDDHPDVEPEVVDEAPRVISEQEFIDLHCQEEPSPVPDPPSSDHDDFDYNAMSSEEDDEPSTEPDQVHRVREREDEGFFDESRQQLDERRQRREHFACSPNDNEDSDGGMDDPPFSPLSSLTPRPEDAPADSSDSWCDGCPPGCNECRIAEQHRERRRGFWSRQYFPDPAADLRQRAERRQEEYDEALHDVFERIRDQFWAEIDAVHDEHQHQHHEDAVPPPGGAPQAVNVPRPRTLAQLRAMTRLGSAFTSDDEGDGKEANLFTVLPLADSSDSDFSGPELVDSSDSSDSADSSDNNEPATLSSSKAPVCTTPALFGYDMPIRSTTLWVC